MLYDQTATDKEAILNNYKLAQQQAAEIGNQVINDAKIAQLRNQLDQARAIGQQEGLAASYAAVDPVVQGGYLQGRYNNANNNGYAMPTDNNSSTPDSNPLMDLIRKYYKG